jgi:hypothetical protein
MTISLGIFENSLPFHDYHNAEWIQMVVVGDIVEERCQRNSGVKEIGKPSLQATADGEEPVSK